MPSIDISDYRLPKIGIIYKRKVQIRPQQLILMKIAIVWMLPALHLNAARIVKSISIANKLGEGFAPGLWARRIQLPCGLARPGWVRADAPGLFFSGRFRRQYTKVGTPSTGQFAYLTDLWKTGAAPKGNRAAAWRAMNVSYADEMSAAAIMFSWVSKVTNSQF